MSTRRVCAKRSMRDVRPRWPDGRQLHRAGHRRPARRAARAGPRLPGEVL